MITGAEAVLFDAGGVLICPDWEEIARIVVAAGGQADPTALAREEGAVFVALDIEVGGTDVTRWRRFVEGVLRAARARCGPAGWDTLLAALAEIHRTHHLWTRVPSDAASTLSELRLRGLRLGVVSNSNGRVSHALAQAGLASFFEVVIDSHLVGIEKPDPRIFHVACEALAVSPGGVVFVGDSVPVDCEGAEGAALRPVLIDRWGRRETRFPRIRDLTELLGDKGT